MPLSGYDLFFINDDILKYELGINNFHERNIAMKLINKLLNEHLRLTIINSNGDIVTLTLDNNQDTSLGELSEYIGHMFNIDPKDILYKDITKNEVLSPTIKIIKLTILYPRIYKTLNVSNMKDYHQEDDDITEQKNENVFNNTNINPNIVNNGNKNIKNNNKNKKDKINNNNMYDNRNNMYKKSMNLDFSNNQKKHKPNNSLDMLNNINKLMNNIDINMAIIILLLLYIFNFRTLKKLR